MILIDYKKTPFDYEDIRSAHHCYKLIFQVPNLMRKNFDNSPHACYRGRGHYKRYVKMLPSNVKRVPLVKNK